MITIEQFNRSSSAWAPSRKRRRTRTPTAACAEVDLGNGERQIVAGIPRTTTRRRWSATQVVVVANLAPATLAA
jgi:hypothetical protein